MITGSAKVAPSFCAPHAYSYQVIDIFCSSLRLELMFNDAKSHSGL